MLDDLNELKTFRAILAEGGLAAARSLGRYSGDGQQTAEHVHSHAGPKLPLVGRFGSVATPLWNDRRLRKRAVPADTAGWPEIARLNAYRLSFHQRSWANHTTIRRATAWTSGGLTFNRYAATSATHVLRRSRTRRLKKVVGSRRLEGVPPICP
jgi:hypothetical protein